MSDYAYGEPVPITLETAAGATASLADYTEVVLTIVQPDGTQLLKKKSDASLTANPYIFAPTQSGRHVQYFVTTGPDGATEPQVFEVEAAGDAGIVSLADAKTELNIPSTDLTNDSELTGFIRAATKVVEHIVGPVASVSYTENYDGGSYLISLRHTPVLSITSVTEYLGRTAYTLTSQPLGSTVDNYGYDLLDADSGTLARRSGAGTPMPFLGGTRGVVVAYKAGRSSTPPNVRAATLELIRVNWQTQQGFDPAFGTPADEVPGPGGGAYLFGLFIPDRVREMLVPDQRMPGIA